MKEELYEIDWKKYLKCTSCWELKEATSDNFRKKTQKRSWFCWICKICNKKQDAVLYKENKERVLSRHKNYVKRNRDAINQHQREYYQANKEKINSRNSNNRRKHIDELWFDRTYFHRKANQYAKKYNLIPKYCSICWKEMDIELHHPSYECFDKRSEVVMCCKSCHQSIHSWRIECPEPVNLLNLQY